MKIRGALVDCSSFLIFVMVALSTTTFLPSVATAKEPWGTRSYKAEKPLYDKEVKKLQQEIRKAKQRLDQSRSQLNLTLGDISGAEYQEFEDWYNKHGNRPPELIRQLEYAKENLAEANRSHETYATSGGPGADDPTFGDNVRNSLWPAHLKRLRAQIAYIDLQAWDEKTRLLAAKKYSYSLFVQLYENAITGMQYVMRRHAEAFFADLADCFGRTIIQGVGSQLLSGYSYASGVQKPAWLTFKKTPGFKDNSITGTDGVTMSCLDDATRGAIVNATTSGIRYNFVSKVTRTWHVPEEIAEFWWAKMINPDDSPDSPWTPHYKSMYDRVTQGVINAAKRAADKNNLTEHAKDFVKFEWERQIRPRIAKKANETALEWLKKARKGAGGGLSRQEINHNAAKSARYHGRKAVENDTSVKWLKAAPYAIAAFNTTFKAVYLNAKKAEFEAAAEPIVKEYHRIVTCLEKLETSTSPGAVINVYKLTRKQDVADFFARCEGQTPDQILAQAQEIGRDLYRLLEEARRVHQVAFASCQSALTDAQGATPAADAADGSRTTDPSIKFVDFRQKVAIIEANARDAYAKGTAVGKAKNATEQAALRACEIVGKSPAAADTSTRRKAVQDMEGSVKTARQQRADSATLIRAIETLVRDTNNLATEIPAAADALAAATPPLPPTGDAPDRSAEITEKLASSRSTGNSLPAITTKAAATYEKQVALLAKLDGATIDRVLVDGLKWLDEIRELEKSLSDCQGQVQAALEGKPESGGETTATASDAGSDSKDVAVLRTQAETAARNLNNTLELAKSYDEAAQQAVHSAELCQFLARMRVTHSQAQSASNAANAVCKAGQQMADKTSGKLSTLQGQIKPLDAEARRRQDSLTKMEALASKAGKYSSDAQQAAGSARRDQTNADRLANQACQRLRDVKSAQSVSEVRAILGEIQNAVSTCKSYAQRVRKAANDAKGAASACRAIGTALSTMTMPAPLPEVAGKARALKGEIDALNAVAANAENRIAVIDGARGQANSLLAQGQASASRLGNNDLARTSIGEMGGIRNRIDTHRGKVSACSGQVRTRAGELTARHASIQASLNAVSASIQKINGRLQSVPFSDRARESAQSAANFAEIAGWSADGMGQILVSVASCQAVAEKALAQANAAQAACAQRPRMKAIPNPSGAGWACTCIDPKDKFSEQLGGCIANNCVKLERAFFGALGAKQTGRARAILKQAGHCRFAGRGPGYIREVECRNNNGRFVAAIKANQLRLAQSILSQSRDCGFVEQGASLLNLAYQNQRSRDRAEAQRQQQAIKNMIDVMRNLGLGGNQRRPSTTTSQPPRPSRTPTRPPPGRGSCGGSGSSVVLLCRESQGTDR